MFRRSFFILLCLCFSLNAWTQKELDYFYPSNVERYGTYAVEFAPGVSVPEQIIVKYQANGWTYVLADRNDLYELLASGIVSKLYREPQGANRTLNDTMRTTHYVNQVHEGLGLDFSFTGKGVIMGYVDSGLDVNHPDFKDSLGNTRVLRFWNQGQDVNWRTPAKYGYGRVYTNVDLNANINPGNINQSGHGTTVTGTGSGNGLANGRNKGVAPECDIIIVRTVFSLPSWTLTVAEGVDYVFSVADSLGMPAVVNLSVGTYLGSHDAKDPAGLYIDSLLNDKAGRLVVCAAGNSGNWPAYHVQKELSSDTNFVWMIPNPALNFGSPGVYFDLWADTADIQNMHFAFGADAPGPVYVGGTNYHQVNFANQTVQFDAIFNAQNDLVGSVIFQGQVVGPNYNLQAIVFTDSLNHRIRFSATGSGKIDMWSSVNIGGSNFSQNIPDVMLFPEFAHYMMPDTLQSIVSSWACSDQVITVGNIQNRKDYIDSQGNVFPVGGGTFPAGKLSVNSSKGPSRQGSVKPELVAAGDMSLSAAVIGLPHPPSSLDIGGMHIRNGGTSMASPVVAGIGALYLEKCPKSNWLDFKNDLISSTFTDVFTGSDLPNFAFGYGKVHALNTLLQTEFHPQISGNSALCSGQTELEVQGNNIDLMVWNTGDSLLSIDVFDIGAYFGTATNDKGCVNFTDTLTVVNDTIPPVALAPDDVIISCLLSVPNADINALSNVSDNCGITEIIHFGDVLINNGCDEFIERTYRIFDAAGNFTDAIQIISIQEGTIPHIVSTDTLIQAVHACHGVFIDELNCESKLITIDPNGNSIDLNQVTVSVTNEFVTPTNMQVSTIPSGGSGYYEISDGTNTFRVGRRMFKVEAPGNFTINGGVKVRLYYDTHDFDGLLNDEPPHGTIVNNGWFKSSASDFQDAIDEMNASPAQLPSAVELLASTGTENGVEFVEFLVQSFSVFGMFSQTVNAPLPITLNSFNAQCQGEKVFLNWTTSSEFNSSHYIIETTRDGFNWTNIGEVEAAGTTNQSSNYSFETNHFGGVSYFRLIQVDYDGTTEIFGPLSTNCESWNNTIKIYPNPSDGDFNLGIQSNELIENAVVEFLDLNGRSIADITISIVPGENLFSLELNCLNSGVYFVRMLGLEDQFPIQKLILKR